MKKTIILVFFMSLTSLVQAGVKNTTVHSRANCINNESITWWLNNSFHWKTVSVHFHYTNIAHHVDTGWNYTWRSAAVHWNEGRAKNDEWEVFGYHFEADFVRGRMPFAETYADDCNIYNGWWDH